MGQLPAYTSAEAVTRMPMYILENGKLIDAINSIFVKLKVSIEG